VGCAGNCGNRPFIIDSPNKVKIKAIKKPEQAILFWLN
jgi:hypothetical protein